MKELFDKISEDCSKNVTKSYSTSFSLATKMLSANIRQDIYNIYGFVRFADEIVDSFHSYNKKELFERFVDDLNHSLKDQISLNPILNSFQRTVLKCNIDKELIDAFLKSMEQDLKKKKYESLKEYNDYIYGSADVVGLMCLKVFVRGDNDNYNKLKPYAMSLGSAFQKVNFLRDLNDDYKKLILELKKEHRNEIGKLKSEIVRTENYRGNFDELNGIKVVFSGFMGYDLERKEIIFMTREGQRIMMVQDNFTGTLVGECGLPVISSENETRCAATIIARLLFHKNGPIMKGLEIVEVIKR